MVQHNSIDHTSVVASALSFGSNANSVSSVSAAGASGSVSRADHVHVGVTSLTHSSNTWSGPITLVAEGAIGITKSSATQININAVAGTSGSGTGIPSGTSFPGGSGAGTLFHRTDLTCPLWRYDGTRWRCTTSHTITLPNWNNVAAGPSTTQSGTLRAPVPPLLTGSNHWLLDTELKFYVNGGTALSGSHKWVVDLAKMDSAASETIIATFTIDSGSSSVFRTGTVNINALLGTTFFVFTTNATKTGTPGNLIHHASLAYQHVAT